ncbi:Ubiquitin-like activating enzyme (UlaA), putative [Penicillium digitatum]|uniref:NEDD8-activating enzyme E1 regulatory subunit n=3 Tax=Penicillium digitatum TaxID=36651 RepID=K9G9Z2_PEND2|nr:Ubiquitin-like activating enzyme (UlaA), putative [Penicillium digitatum Pd1]EKV15812.1 Ubiquitin-like activating enzyme (UlaA), putative [Penicillium digitatum Pd1]EKV17877.1 Ubiquitin-like activating enzyme (UlaA), putative [Penicillium digitatum PHI26]QQK42318.1 Ubiquitin-like activating enzyme (UlaA), putative [Penicillium digitatum]
MTDAFPAALTGPTSKERKYDRQLRLWAATGQQALEDSHVLLVNSDGPLGQYNTGVAGVAGVETLKNLVLPGIGGFTIVDPAIVTESDLGVNFFLEEESLGKSRAEETCRLLKELNPDVEGQYYLKRVEELLMDPEFLPQHKLVIISGPMRRSTLVPLIQEARQLGIPVLYLHSIGFFSTFSVQLPAEFPIVETHPDPESTQDLRLLNPWPELVAAAAHLDNLDTLDDHQHGHVPYILLLLHFLEQWKQSHKGNAPSNYKEKTEFREFVRSQTRTANPEGGEENFDEAVAAVLKTISPFSLRSSIREIFEMSQCQQLSSSSQDFWIIASAIKTFHASHGVLPLPGSLPDMKAQSADYVSLQNIYKAKARQDVEEVTVIVRELEATLKRQAPAIPDRDIEVFCKNAAHIKVVLGRDIPQISIDSDASTLKTIRNQLNDPDSLIPIFIATQILDSVVDEIQSSSLEKDRSVDDDGLWNSHTERILALLTAADGSAVCHEARAQIARTIKELRRAEGGELHNISSFTGGLVAQEALKVITRQYGPLDNTCVFDGARSKSEMYRL